MLEKLQWNVYDHEIWKQGCFDLPDSIILDMVSGQQMAIDDQDIFRAGEAVIRAVQAFYFCSVENISLQNIHPRIENA